VAKELVLKSFDALHINIWGTIRRASPHVANVTLKHCNRVWLLDSLINNS